MVPLEISHVLSIILRVFSVNPRIILHIHETLLWQSRVHTFRAQGMARVSETHSRIISRVIHQSVRTPRAL